MNALHLRQILQKSLTNKKMFDRSNFSYSLAFCERQFFLGTAEERRINIRLNQKLKRNHMIQNYKKSPFLPH